MALKIIRYYFVHRKRVYPKPYLAVLDRKLNDEVKVGTVLKYEAETEVGRRWQTIVVTDTYSVTYRPRFNAILGNEVRIKQLNAHEQVAWHKFSRDHGYQALTVRRKSDD